MERALWSMASRIGLSLTLTLTAACPGNANSDAGTVRDASLNDAAAMDVNSVDGAVRADVNTVDMDALDGASSEVGDTNVGDATSLDARLDANNTRLDAASSVASDAPLASLLDVNRDAGSDATRDAPRTGVGPSQCSAIATCPDGNFCTNRAPGGVCGCFPGTETCPAGTSCDVDLGACIRDCTSDLDCIVGMACARLTGRCSLRNCDVGTPCPNPYVCTTGRCLRPICAAGESCPAGWSCDGEYCAEP